MVDLSIAMWLFTRGYQSYQVRQDTLEDAVAKLALALALPLALALDATSASTTSTAAPASASSFRNWPGARLWDLR